MEKLPKIFDKKPAVIAVEKGKKYFWCSCGLSSKQPFCDGKHRSHKDESGAPLMKPVIFEATKDENIYFCNCKKSKNGALCDATHSII